MRRMWHMRHVRARAPHTSICGICGICGHMRHERQMRTYAAYAGICEHTRTPKTPEKSSHLLGVGRALAVRLPWGVFVIVPGAGRISEKSGLEGGGESGYIDACSWPKSFHAQGLVKSYRCRQIHSIFKNAACAEETLLRQNQTPTQLIIVKRVPAGRTKHIEEKQYYKENKWEHRRRMRQDKTVTKLMIVTVLGYHL